MGRIIFRTASIHDAWILFRNTFKIFKYGFQFNTLRYIVPSLETMVVALIATLVLLIVDLIKEKKQISIIQTVNKKSTVLQTVVIILLIVSIILLGSYGPGISAKDFEYMQF